MAQFGSLSQEEEKSQEGLEPHCQLGKWIVMPPLISMLHVKRYVRLPLSTRSVPAESPRSGMQRACPQLAAWRIQALNQPRGARTSNLEPTD
jgi:hypothetical protein